VTLPGSHDHFQRTMSRRPKLLALHHSMPDTLHSSYTPPMTMFSASSSSPASVPTSSQKIDHEHALDIATHSWDLATGGLKTLTAKRELPIRPERYAVGVVPDMLATSRSHTFALVIVVCVGLMLFGGGIVLFVMLQP
jgi:hypothetical protein